MRERHIATAIVLATILSAAIVYGVFRRSYAIPSHASIKAIKLGIYFDAQLTQRVTELDWGVLEPGENATKLLYLQNQANIPTTLFMTTQSWNPASASDFITQTWNYTGEVLQIDEVLLVEFVLRVSPSISGITSFSFELIVGAMG